MQSSFTSPIKSYFIVNRSLKMGAGKIGGQVGHAAARLTRLMERLPILFTADQVSTYHQWVNTNEAKIVLGSDEATMCVLREKYIDLTVQINDGGLTQINPNSFTVLGFIPMTAEQVPEELKYLKLHP